MIVCWDGNLVGMVEIGFRNRGNVGSDGWGKDECICMFGEIVKNCIYSMGKRDVEDVVRVVDEEVGESLERG